MKTTTTTTKKGGACSASETEEGGHALSSESEEDARKGLELTEGTLSRNKKLKGEPLPSPAGLAEVWGVEGARDGGGREGKAREENRAATSKPTSVCAH